MALRRESRHRSVTSARERALMSALRQQPVLEAQSSSHLFKTSLTATCISKLEHGLCVVFGACAKVHGQGPRSSGRGLGGADVQDLWRGLAPTISCMRAHGRTDSLSTSSHMHVHVHVHVHVHTHTDTHNHTHTTPHHTTPTPHHHPPLKRCFSCL